MTLSADIRSRNGEETAIVVFALGEKSIASFRELVQRGANLWPDAPAEIKEFADIITNGKVQQQYAATVVPRYHQYHQCSCGYITAIATLDGKPPEYLVNCANPSVVLNPLSGKTGPCKRVEPFNAYKGTNQES